MGYDIYIGEAKMDYNKNDIRITVDITYLDGAPVFPNDEMTGNSNARHPSYIGWTDFCKEAGLYDLFFAKYTGLMSSRPGCAPITKDHVLQVRTVLNKWRETVTKLPGFAGFPTYNKESDSFETPDENIYDHIYARLIWLEFWMAWAVENCEHPAIMNT